MLLRAAQSVTSKSKLPLDRSGMDSSLNRTASRLRTGITVVFIAPANKQGTYHERAVPTVCGLVSDAAQPVRVRGHAASALVNFTDTEGVPEEAVTPHLDALLSALCTCLNGAVPQSVQVSSSAR